MDGRESREKHVFYRKYGKRIFDLFFSSLAILVLSPVILILTAAVRIKHGSPVLFSPTRPGLNERIFHIYKFRSMSNARDAEGNLLPDKDRVTKLGEFLRAFSLDELPELFNIFFGDMSFVGPRPQAKATLPAYTEETRKRFSVRPGLTGLAQINGRNDLDWDRRFQFDLDYIERMSLGYDLKIILDTVLKVVKASDVVIPGTSEKVLYNYNAQRKIESEGAVFPVGENGKREEIGGDFWLLPEDEETGRPSSGSKLVFPRTQDSTYTFVGRAAIELALVDLKSQRPIKKACVPSYCSFGMLQAFMERDISYDFYEVEWNGTDFDYKIDPNRKYDVVLLMTYFGINPKKTDELVSALHKKGCAVIEDITHSLLSSYQRKEEPDYYAASLRKWLPVPAGGWLGKTSGSLAQKPDREGGTWVGLNTKAMEQKGAYITGKTEDKNTCLVNYAEFEMWLVLMDCKSEMDALSKKLLDQADFEDIRNRRNANAGHLYERLSGIKELSFMNKPSDWDTTCPVSVPVFLPHAQRNRLVHFLAEKGIFCETPWPERMGAPAGIRENILALVCDQRYSVSDMDRIADAIVSFTAEHHMEGQGSDSSEGEKE